MTGFIVIYFFLINIIGLLIMKMDKQRAIKHQYRISEQTLWIIAIIGGAVGTAVGMNMFRHKTKRLSFKIGFQLLAVIDLFLLFYFI
ncbi:DUF1294 domain-containing protein [Niallia endozanthoxylica]|uniref:DUF1294 domain-containing protein n=1 Tax=Niallia endozanthoxylica TaxID=2036016 RepID=A0A5J5HP02_9BACI|nr:DUF1294 domain-containing protein [Niallia endozanthoxylica]KAA9023201.1 DUF1294 domain-containing protein [Niallia endozanthoxylica]